MILEMCHAHLYVKRQGPNHRVALLVIEKTTGVEKEKNTFKDVHETISANESFGMFFFFGGGGGGFMG